MHRGEDEDDERRRQRKREEALEVKSLRRIISAYLNYPEAAEEEVRRYERSFQMLPPSHKGQEERDQCYKPILEEFDSLFADRSKETFPACLVPGAGLGRLALDISCLGFISQGNEFSYYMMICSSFILNHSRTAGEWTVYPCIHSNCNSLSDSDQLRPISVPDIHPARTDTVLHFGQ